MTEDFIGTGGKLEEKFIEAADNSLIAEVFSPYIERASKEKPQLLPGLEKLKSLLFTNQRITIRHISIQLRIQLRYIRFLVSSSYTILLLLVVHSY